MTDANGGKKWEMAACCFMIGVLRLCRTNLFVIRIAAHQHLEHVAHRVSSHWWDGLPCDLTRVALLLMNSGSCKNNIVSVPG